MKEYIENNFEDEIKIIKLQEIFSMKFDIIISNPPYAIGNELTKAIVDNVDFDEFVNLMPVSKYKAKELYKNVSSIQSIEDTFEDAAVGDSLTVAVLKNEGGNTNVTMVTKWPVRVGRPYKRKLSPDILLTTGQRPIDTLFPLAKGGVAAVPGSSFFMENVPDIVRLHFAKKDETLNEALERLSDMKKKMLG